MILSADTIRPQTKIVGRRIVCLDSCASTNDEAWRLALEGAADGTVVFAEEQSKGRGRFGRSWTAPRGASLLGSAILRPALDPERVPLMTAIGALAVAEAVESAGLEPRIVFPNDIFVNGRKIAGVLVESRFISSRPDLFIVGIGVNVNIAKAEFPPELRELATSLSIETGVEGSRARLARALLESLDQWVGELGGGLRRVKKEWRDRSHILGRRVRVRENGKSFAGTVTEVDPLMGLELRLDTGHARAVRGEHVEKLDIL